MIDKETANEINRLCSMVLEYEDMVHCEIKIFTLDKHGRKNTHYCESMTELSGPRLRRKLNRIRQLPYHTLDA